MRKVLNVGGNSKAIPLPQQYAGWEHVLLDIDASAGPDIVCDARELRSTPAAAYESVYCSHNLEHYHHHDVPRVLAGFVHVLKPRGFAFIRVPDIKAVAREMLARDLDIEDVLYTSPSGPIRVRDVIYGYGIQIERSGNDFYAHKTGFTEKSLLAVLQATGFRRVYTGTQNLEVIAYAFVDEPDDYATALLRLPPVG